MPETAARSIQSPSKNSALSLSCRCQMECCFHREPASSLKDLFLQNIRFPCDLRTRISRVFVVKLDNVEMIENQDSFREIFPDHFDIGRTHIRCYCFDLCLAVFQLLPKGCETLRGFSVRHFNQRTAVQIHCDCQVTAAGPEVDFVDGDPLEFGRFGFIEAPV
uniref:Uncharacterized protein n=1 Tax=Candidatus Kentrum sp. TC TaxID=2126339 RepID=A0A450Z0D1_9GAMM|nr:MAG: hypothetical protein BECKTC1821E_GA0114239_103329 [Candidatus Kentron sp. TC]VFK47243.1 MAG: hypothetical protein BECKTC1821D_GA0114238_104319 [Candidatus Kentron sp. TC]VFK63207.1 MAG: hypothetical protein BECKTC1821F_GA0114240_10886 [Candidatus Kentron sp. TC]